MNVYRFEIEYQGGQIVSKQVNAANVAAAWFTIALQVGDFAKKIELQYSFGKES